ncbi:MAG: hypothetical protein GQ569_02815 [Methylococcaceae bacterium]|nr:hypothetical protein [Methylococcaceae bacterium]
MKYLNPLIFFTLSLFFQPTLAKISTIPDTNYEYNKDVIRGQLDNGLKYFILKNDKPENQAELRLIVEVGSLEEADNQRGLAHFVEHLAFNGTKNYEKNTLDAYLQTLGMTIGAHVNAYTSYERTVYQLSVPTDKPKDFEKTIQVLEEWAHNISFTKEEFEKERGVVLEEERARKGLWKRMYDQTKVILFNNAKYAERDPIGKTDIIKNTPVEVAKQFYDTWYRPEFMSLVIVGDFDTQKVEAMIKSKFSALKNKATQKRAKRFVEPVNHARYKVVSDKEYTDYSFSLKLIGEDKPVNSKAEKKTALIRSLAQSIFNDRLSEMRKEKNPPFISSYLSRSSFVTGVEITEFNLNIEKSKYEIAEKRLFKEIARVNQHGFNANELKLAKRYNLAQLKQSYIERNDKENPVYTSEIISSILYKSTYLNIQNHFFISKALLAEITLKDVNDYFKGILNNKNQLFLYSTPEKEKQNALSLAQTQTLLSNALATKVEPYPKKEIGILLAKQPQAGSIKSSKEHENIGVTEYLLSNGIKVFFKKTDFKKDSFNFTAFSEGGTSLEIDKDYFDTLAAGSVAGQSGYGNHTVDDLNRINAGKIAGVWSNIGQLYENVGGYGIQSDMKTAFELIYLTFTQPRFEDNIFTNYKRDLNKNLEAKKSRPIALYYEELTDFFYKKHLRVRSFRTKAEIESLKIKNFKKIYQSHFNNAADFTFVFVGDINQQDFEKNISHYLASLPITSKPAEHYKDLKINPREGSHSFIRKNNPEDRSDVVLLLTKASDFSLRKSMIAGAVSHIVSIKLKDLIREEKSSVYSIGLNSVINRVPKAKFFAISSFTCDPKKTSEVIALVNEVINDIKKNGIEQKHLDNYVVMAEKGYKKSIKRNGFWLGKIDYALKNKDPFENILKTVDDIKSIRKEEIQEFVKEYFTFENYVESIFTTKDYK